MSKTRKSPAKTTPANTLTVHTKPDENEAVALARTVLRPTVQGAATLCKFNQELGEIDLTQLVERLSAQAKLVNDGMLERGEAMLTVQAHTLDAIFNALARRAALNMGEYMGACETYLKLALRAQAQCRASWEAIANIKNPPLAGYVKQANIAHGHQQVNNASAPDTPRARETENPPTQLLEQNDGERLDFGTTPTTGATDTTMETVGTIDRTQNHRG